MPKHKKDKHVQSAGQQAFPPGQAPNPPAAGSDQGAIRSGDDKAFQGHDAANRLGSFETRGNHSRTGNRGHQ